MLTNDHPERLKIFRIVLLALFLPVWIFAQGNGDPLTFQGLSTPNDLGVRALAMGNAYTAQTGDLNALYFNSAGLADIQKFQFSISVKSTARLQQENQFWTESRKHPLLPTILEGRYIPDPANNGAVDDSLIAWISPEDVALPVTGVDPFSKEAADWQHKKSGLPFGSVAAAYPMQISGRQLTVAAAFNRSFDLYDYDRNDTFLDPHFGKRTDPQVITQPDSLHMNWSRYVRQRSGDVNSLKGAVAFKLNKNINLGVGFNTMFGETDDILSLSKEGILDLTSNSFTFRYDTLETVTTGASKFSGTNYNFGFNLTYERLSLGFNVNTSYTLEREWDYSTRTESPAATNTEQLSGTDKVELPATYSFGVSLAPKEQVCFSFDVQHTPYGKAKFSFADPTIVQDSTFVGWADQTILRFGAAYQPTDYLTLLAGYRSVPQTFIPHAAAFRNHGPAAESITFGISLKIYMGHLDIAYEYRKLKYFDTWESNLNYVLQTQNNFLFGYTIML